MKKGKLWRMLRVILPLIAVLILAGCLSFDSGTTVTIRNNTGFTIWYVYISPTTQSTWGSDWLDSTEEIRDRGSRRFALPDGITSYDIMLVDIDGDRYEKRNVQIPRNMTVTFTFDDFDLDYFNERTGQR